VCEKEESINASSGKVKKKGFSHAAETPRRIKEEEFTKRTAAESGS